MTDTIGLLVSQAADRLLLVDFLHRLGYRVHLYVSSELVYAESTAVSLILADVGAARRNGKELARLKAHAGGAFLPLLLLLPATAASTLWLKAGFDDVLRMPLVQDDLRVRLEAQLALRKNSQAQYREIFEQAPIGIFRADAGGQMLMLNPAMLQLLGYASVEEFLASPLENGTAAFYAPAHLKELLVQAMQTHTLEVLWPRRDGSPLFVRTLARAQCDADGTVLYYEGTFEDITERKQMEVQLRQANANLERRVAERTAELHAANKELHALSHKVVLAQEAERRHLALELHDEIGQTLTAVKLNLQLLEGLMPDAAAAARLQESERIVGLAMDQVRKLAFDLRPPALDMVGLLPALQIYLERQARQANLVIQLSADPLTVPPATELQPILYRLTQEAVTNIVRHARAKNVQVELHQHKTELELVIRDDGAGFDVKAARKAAKQGLHLGLMGMQERVELLEGQFQVRSKPGAGTEIRARLPLRRAVGTSGAGRKSRVKKGKPPAKRRVAVGLDK